MIRTLAFAARVAWAGRRLRLACAALLVAAGAAAALAVPAAGRAADPPSIVVILTDDQRWDTLWAMPTVANELAGRGVSFTNAFVTNPLCCPSRATLLTGGYSHDHGVYTNGGPHGPARFDDSSTIATWLQGAGYSTAFVGKYLQGIGTRIPPGWDHWFAINGGSQYFDYRVNDDGTIRSYADAEADYSTDVLASEAMSFIRETDGPVFVLLSVSAPHANGHWNRHDPLPAPRHAGAFANHEPRRPPSFDEADVSDKPPYIRKRELTPELIDRIDGFGRAQLESLQAVDEGVAGILGALNDTGRLDTAMIVFTSDNGFSLGEHRWVAKWAPYDESVRVPLVIRHDPLTSHARTDDSLVVNVDIAPTLAELAGAPAPGASGASLLSALAGVESSWRRDFVLERAGTGIPPYCGIRSVRHLYVQYRDGFEEVYDLAADPYQLENLAGAPGYRKRIVGFRGRLGKICDPPPPRLRLMGPCLVPGTHAADRLTGTRWYDLICGKRGDDGISARAGRDRIEGGEGRDAVSGGKGEDKISGGADADVLRGGADGDSIVGGAGDDLLSGDGGRDRLRGGGGKDTIRAADGEREQVTCGSGRDIAFVDASDHVIACEKTRARP